MTRSKRFVGTRRARGERGRKVSAGLFALATVAGLLPLVGAVVTAPPAAAAPDASVYIGVTSGNHLLFFDTVTDQVFQGPNDPAGNIPDSVSAENSGNLLVGTTSSMTSGHSFAIQMALPSGQESYGPSSEVSTNTHGPVYADPYTVDAVAGSTANLGVSSVVEGNPAVVNPILGDPYVLDAVATTTPGDVDPANTLDTSGMYALITTNAGVSIARYNNSGSLAGHFIYNHSMYASAGAASAPTVLTASGLPANLIAGGLAFSSADPAGLFAVVYDPSNGTNYLDSPYVDTAARPTQGGSTGPPVALPVVPGQVTGLVTSPDQCSLFVTSQSTTNPATTPGTLTQVNLCTGSGLFEGDLMRQWKTGSEPISPTFVGNSVFTANQVSDTLTDVDSTTGALRTVSLGSVSPDSLAPGQAMTGATALPIDQSVFVGGNTNNFLDYYDAAALTLNTAFSPSNNQEHPAQVAGNGTNQILVGESDAGTIAHDEVDVYNTVTQTSTAGQIESPPLFPSGGAGAVPSHLVYSPDGTSGAVSDASGEASTLSVDSPSAATSVSHAYTLGSGDSYTVAAMDDTAIPDVIWGPNAQAGSSVFAIVHEANGVLGLRRADPSTGQFYKGIAYSFQAGFNTEMPVTEGAGTDATSIQPVGLYYDPDSAESGSTLPSNLAVTYDPVAGANQGTYIDAVTMMTGNSGQFSETVKTSIPAGDVPESAALSPDGCTLWVTALDTTGNFSWLYALKTCVTKANGFGTGTGTTMSFKNAVAMTTDAADDIFVASTSPSNELTDITAGDTGTVKQVGLPYTPTSLALGITPAPSVNPTISVALNASASSTPAGIRSVALDNNGTLPTVVQQNSVVGSGAPSASPNAGVAATKLNAIKLSAIKLSAIKLSAIKLSAIKLSAIAVGPSTAAQTGLSDITLANVGVTYVPPGCTVPSCQGWPGILAGSRYANYPLQSVTLQDVLSTTGSDTPDGLNPEERLDALPLADIDVSGSSLGSFPVAAYATGGESIANIPLNSSDTTPTAVLTTWCTALNALHFPCSQFGIDPNTPSTASGTTLLALGLAGVPLQSLPIDSIPLTATSVNNSPIQSIKLSAISIGDTGLSTVKLSAIKLSAINLGTIKLSAIKLSAIKLGAIKLSAIKLSAINLATIKLSAIKLSAIKLSAIDVGAVKLSAINIGASKLSAIKLSAISTVSSLVNCGTGAGQVDCSAAAGKTLGDAAAANAILSSGDLTTLQNGISVTNPDPNWIVATLSDIFGLDASGSETDATTLLQLESLAAGNPSLQNLFNTLALSDVGGADNQTTLNDIETHLAAGTTDDTALGDLLANESSDDVTTLGNIISEIAADDASALNGLYLGDLLAGLVPESTYPWTDVDVDTPGLAAASADGGQVTLTATSTVTNGPAALTYALTVPAGFSLVSGSALFDGVGSPDPVLSGSTLTGSPGNSTGTDTYSVVVRPNEVLGLQKASVVASLPGNITSSSSVNMNITDPFSGNTSAATATTLVPDTLNLSFLSSPTTSAYWDINVPAGDELALDLSNLPADYDMVLYGPPATQLQNPPVQHTGGVTVTPPPDQSTTGQQSAPNQGDLPILTSNPVLAVSSSRGLVPEQITTPELSGGNYLIQVSGYNGAFSTSAPYALRGELVQTPASPACSVPTYPNGLNDAANPFHNSESLPAPAAYLANTDANHNVVAPNTLFLVDPDRLYQAYGAANASTIMADAAATASDTAANGMSGVLVPVEGDPTTAAAYAAWDANPCSVAAANAVVTDINTVVRGIVSAHPSIRDIVIIGSDDQVPMARIPDNTVTDNESDYAAGTLPGINDQLAAALSTGNFLSDDPYASPTPLGVGGQSLYTPSMVVGRLVESPTQIENSLNRYVSTGGTLDASSGLSTGYDFLTQGAQAIGTDLTLPRAGSKVSSLINNAFSVNDLKSALDGTAGADHGVVPSVQSINGHFDFSRMLSGAGDALADTATNAQVNAEILNSSDVRDDPNLAGPNQSSLLAGRLLFSMGCHAGLNIPDNEIDNVVSGGLDSWAKTFADDGALWVANTGYGYADDQYIAYSARLMGLFAQNLDGSLTVGQALAQAKQRYAADTGVLDPYDLKAAMESTFYGMPNYKLNGTTSSAGTPSLPQLNTGTDPVTNLTTATVNVNIPVGTNNTTANQYGPIQPNEGGEYYQVNGSTDEQTSTGFPIEPLVRQDVTLPGAGGSLSQVAHGALITSLTSADLGTMNRDGSGGQFVPSIAEAQSDLSADEQSVPQLETAFPATLQRVATFQLFDPATGNPITHQEANFITGQYIPSATTPGLGNQRLFTGITSSIEYAATSDTKFNPPTINESQGFVQGSGANQTVAFNVLASAAPGGSAVKEVLVLFIDTAHAGTASAPATWTAVPLTHAADGSWTGGAPAPASGTVSYIVQAVDGDGNVAMASNKGVDFSQVPVAKASGLSANASGATQTNGYYNGPVTLTVTGPSGATITYQVDGGSPQTVTSPAAISVTGDGTHVITASDGQGDQLSQAVSIDTAAPVITTEVTAPRTSGGFASGGASLSISAADAGSGVKTLTYRAGSGPVTTVSGPITPPQGITTYTITATDFLGHTATTTVSTNVDATAPTVSCTGADGQWHSTDQTSTCTATDSQSGVAPPNPLTLSTSVPAGTATANASTNAGQMCDQLSNCSPAGPVSGFKVDKAAPTVSCPSADTNWHTSPVTFTCTAADVGSGLVGSSSILLTASAPANSVNAHASTNTVAVCDVAGNCTTAGPITNVMVDNSAPTVTCPSADANWHTGTVTFTCTGVDTGSGSPSSVMLTASLPAGQSSATVSTNTVQLCDGAGNCSTAGPITHVMIDNAAPTVSCPNADSNWHSGTVTFTCTTADSGSGLATASQSSIVLSASIAANTQSSNVSTNATSVCDKQGNCAPVGPITHVMIDNTAPVVSCPNADGNWHMGTVTLTCSATDSGSGLASQAPITVSASAPAGTVNAHATTNTTPVCDVAGNCSTAGPITNVMIDNTSPVSTCPSADSSWHTGTVTFTCTGTDTGSGLANPSGTLLVASIPAGTTNANASSNSAPMCDVAGNCVTVGPITHVMIDDAAPTIVCPSADTSWHTGTVTFTCTASDSGSGLANASQSSITLTASIPANTGNGNVSTNSVSVCDKVGNCGTAGPITNVMIDNSAPTVNVTSPTMNQIVTLNGSLTAGYTCAESGVGIASCIGKVSGTPVANGGALPTGAVGTYALTVTATSTSGKTTVLSVTYKVTYAICNFLPPVTPLVLLGTVTFAVTVCDATGKSVGGGNVAITGIDVDGSLPPNGVLGNGFKWVPVTNLYAFVMAQFGLAKGNHVLDVTVTGDPVTHPLAFTLT